MDFRSMVDRASEKIRTVFSRDNSFFYGTGERIEPSYAQEAQQQPVQGVYPNVYQQQPYAQQQGARRTAQPANPQAYQQPYQQPYPQQPYPQQPFQQPAAPAQGYQQQAWQAPQSFSQQQTDQQQYAQTFQQPTSPQQMQLDKAAAETSGRNRRTAQHIQEGQIPQGNLVQFPGAPQGETENRMMDAYVVNITSITGCRQAMTCLRKGQCTLVVMDQLVDKAEVRRYVDMLNGACFALGGTMTRLSLKVGFYILAPSGMMVYTDPVTASANAPHARPAAHQPAAQQQPWQDGPVRQAQQGAEYQAPAQPYQAPVQPNYPPQAQPGPFAPPHAAGYAPAAQTRPENAYEDERYAL